MFCKNHFPLFSQCKSSKFARLYARSIIKPGTVSPELLVPSEINRPPYITDPEKWRKEHCWVFADPDLISQSKIITLDKEEQEKLRASCKLAKRVLQYAGSLVKPGITTDEIDRLVHQVIISENAYPSPLYYRTSTETSLFPKSICTSVNEVMCHGIPDSTVLKVGDIITIDVTVYLNGFHGDTAKTFFVGKPTDSNLEKLVTLNEEAVMKAISVCGPGAHFRQVGSAIERLAAQNNLTVAQDAFGHGIGRQFHQHPFIAHFANNMKGTMKPGMAFTIEPLMCLGGSESFTWDDKWTTASKDGSWSAQREHTVLITEDGAEALTLW